MIEPDRMIEDNEEGMTAYDAFGQLSTRLSSPVVLSGRYSFQASEISELVADVKGKLLPERSNRLMEIGCNVGILLTPLADLVDEAVGIDHPQVLEQYRKAGVPENVTLISGQWPHVKPFGGFDRILVYSVLHYLLNAQSVFDFVDACLAVLRPGGRLLLGDIPNSDVKNRFVKSPHGQQFSAMWNKRKVSSNSEDEIAAGAFARLAANAPGLFDDEFLFRILRETRSRTFDSYLLPQSPGLPFGNTREDILILKRS